MRTIYRRALLIAPWLNPNGTAGLLEILPSTVAKADADRAIAALIRFQDTYDLSVRLEWDALAGRWKILANTLADLTKRENRFGHYGYVPGVDRAYPFPATSAGSGYSSSTNVRFIYEDGSSHDAQVIANEVGSNIVSYFVQNFGSDNGARPFAYVPGSTIPATANAMTDDNGRVVRVLHGPAPLGGLRRGQDVMLTNVLGFDLRVFDPGAPIYQEATTLSVLEPSDPGWSVAYNYQIGTASPTPMVGQGSYVDMGYAFHVVPQQPSPVVAPNTPWIVPWFANPKGIYHYSGTLLTPGYSIYDTWTWSFEINGIDEDGRLGPDQATNGLDDDSSFGPDDVGERETRPPYDKPLRGVQVVLRVYETDARQIRQVRVNQHFLGE